MHFFAGFLFLAFGVMALTMLGERLYRRVREGRAFVAGGWGVALAWLANFNMWTGWDIAHLRYAWVGVTLTGVALGGAALLAYSLLGFFFGLHRKFDDQAEQLERTELRRVA
ncbi:MAG TPA: hypothetical protein VKV23_04465 [Acidimicrobiales bacterium]|nr:hypothetical protein [Acidimicrobiales bacterium]